MSRDTSRSGEFPPSRHKDRGSVRPRWCGVFRVEVREARTMHIIRRTLLGASAVGLATLLSVGHPDVVRSARRSRDRGTADPAVRRGTGRGEVARDPAGRRWQHRRLPLVDGERHSGPGRRARHRCGPVGVVLHGGQRQLLHHCGGERRRRRSGSVGPPDSGCARNERRPDQLRRDEPPGEAAGHRADVRCRRRAVRDGDAAERLPRRRLRPRSRLHRPQGRSGRRPMRRRSAG